MSPDIGVCT